MSAQRFLAYPRWMTKNSNDTVIKVGSFIDVDINRRQFIFQSSTLEKIDHNTAYFTVFYGSVQ